MNLFLICPVCKTEFSDHLSYLNHLKEHEKESFSKEDYLILLLQDLLREVKILSTLKENEANKRLTGLKKKKKLNHTFIDF